MTDKGSRPTAPGAAREPRDLLCFSHLRWDFVFQRPHHLLGSKGYAELPDYLSGWDVALIPFARNEATRFISPTKTPEYLAGGIPVVSTGIRDVVRPYGQQALVRIAETVPEFVAAVRAALAEDSSARAARLQRVDGFLQQNSWDLTWNRMKNLMEERAVSVAKE